MKQVVNVRLLVHVAAVQRAGQVQALEDILIIVVVMVVVMQHVLDRVCDAHLAASYYSAYQTAL